MADAGDRRSIDDFADKLQRRADRARAAGETERLTEDHLDDVLGNRGFFCLHDCRWPGSKTANIDHVVVGPSGVWVIDDKRFTRPVTISRKGEAWTGRFPLAPQITKAQHQATAVAAVIPTCPTVHTVLSIHQAPMPDGTKQIDGVWISQAGWDTTSVILRSPSVLSDAAVEGLAQAAIDALVPASVTRPNANTAHLDMPAGPALGLYEPQSRRFDRGTQSSQPPRHRPNRLGRAPRRSAPRLNRPGHSLWRSARSRLAPVLQRLAVMVAVVWLAVAFGDDATRIVVRKIEQATTKALQAPLSVTYDCRAPGAGWVQVVRWKAVSGQVIAAEWSAVPAGPWAQLPHSDGVAERPNVGPSEQSNVRVRYSPAPATEAQITAAATSPATAC